MKAKVSSSQREPVAVAWKGDYSAELAVQDRNTEHAGHTGTKDATVGASKSRALTHSNRGLSSSLWTGVSWKFPKSSPSLSEGSKRWESLVNMCVRTCSSTKEALFSRAFRGYKSGFNPSVVQSFCLISFYLGYKDSAYAKMGRNCYIIWPWIFKWRLCNGQHFPAIKLA